MNTVSIVNNDILHSYIHIQQNTFARDLSPQTGILEYGFSVLLPKYFNSYSQFLRI